MAFYTIICCRIKICFLREDCSKVGTSGAFSAFVKLEGTRLSLLSWNARECEIPVSLSPYFSLFILFSLKKGRLGHIALVCGR